MSKMVYLPYVHFEQGKGEPKGNGWYFTTMQKLEKVKAGTE